METGDLVERWDGQYLRSGASMYSVAVVASTSPFVLISTGGDMLWSVTIRPEDFKVVGKATKTIMRTVSKRYRDYLKNKIN